MEGSENWTRAERLSDKTLKVNGRPSGTTLPPPRLPCCTVLRPAGVGSNVTDVASAGRAITGATPESFPLRSGKVRSGQIPDLLRLMRATWPAFTRIATVRLPVVADRTPATSTPSIVAPVAATSSSKLKVLVSLPSADTALVDFATSVPGASVDMNLTVALASSGVLDAICLRTSAACAAGRDDRVSTKAWAVALSTEVRAVVTVCAASLERPPGIAANAFVRPAVETPGGDSIGAGAGAGTGTTMGAGTTGGATTGTGTTGAGGGVVVVVPPVFVGAVLSTKESAPKS